MKVKTALILICLVTIVTAAAWINYTNLNEAFGSGPPYYGRTTNMDKWTNPIPTLMLIDIVAALLLVILFKVGFRNAEK
jgi:ABC-type multidrug transport system permease subunit